MEMSPTNVHPVPICEAYGSSLSAPPPPQLNLNINRSISKKEVEGDFLFRKKSRKSVREV